jgi:hypothetical protein
MSLRKSFTFMRRGNLIAAFLFHLPSHVIAYSGAFM